MTTITADTYWDIDGVPLNTPAYSIEELDGLMSLPPRRGSNFIVPYHPGQLYRPKQHDAVTRTMLAWVCWKDLDGVSAGTRALRQGQFEANLDQLRGLLAAGQQHTLTRRLFDSGGNLVTRTFQGEAFNSVSFKYMENDYWPSAEFAVDFLCADPYFYGAQQSFVLGPAARTVTHTNRGSLLARKMSIVMQGPLDHPVLDNLSFFPDVSLRVAKTLGANDFVALDTEEFTAIDQAGGNVVAIVSRANSREWMQLQSGDNLLKLTTDNAGDTGTVTVSYAPVYA